MSNSKKLFWGKMITAIGVLLFLQNPRLGVLATVGICLAYMPYSLWNSSDTPAGVFCLLLRF